MKLGSLFDGIGGFPWSASKFGFNPVWASEIEPWPIKVTQKHFLNMKHLGDITQINGAEIEPVDIITFGSPCQDLSVAGKREGLEGQRSGLFMDAVRIIRQMRESTGGQFPRFAVWENVPGALSSNKGEDFRAVIEELSEAEIPLPQCGKWANAGMVTTERLNLSWAIRDAQYHGIPQRRRRIFLVVQYSPGEGSAEVLFIEEGLSGHITESREARQEAAGNAGTSVAITMRMREGCAGGGKGPLISEDKPLTLGCNNDQAVFARTTNNICGCLSQGAHPGGFNGQDAYSHQLIIEPQLYDMTHADEVMRPVEKGIAPTLNSRMGTGGNQVPVLINAYSLQGSMIGRADKNGPQGDGINEEVSFTLNTIDRHAVAYGVDKKGDDEFAKSNERNAREILRKLREEIGTEAFAEWGSGILNSLQQAEILQPGLYGEALGENGQAQKEEYIDRQPRQSDSPKDEQPDIKQSGLREVREYVEKIRHTPQGLQYLQQFARELDGIMQELPQHDSQQTRKMFDMWQAGKGIRLLRKTLSEIQEVGRPDASQNQPEYPRYAVRRLVPTECLRLQGFPDWWLDIEGMSDSAKYKAIGNSVAIPCVDFVMSGIARVLRREGR